MTGRPRRHMDARSEGVRLLVASGKSQAEIGAIAGVTQPTVARWMSGEKIPSDLAKGRLESGLGIHRSKWRQRPAEEPRAPTPRRRGPVADAPAVPSIPAAGAVVVGPSGRPRLGKLAALARQREAAAHAHEHLDAVMAADSKASAREKSDAMRAASAANIALGKLESLQRATMQDLLDSDDWTRVIETLRDVLSAHAIKHGDVGKEVCAALAEAMRELHEGSDAYDDLARLAVPTRGRA